ncbi:peptidylprolyl isomerase [Maritimibacter sp. 55A14]|uniref:peptidylprolyl isomerase n=1 Tax=Maritimibacter sp. 55A14 TaxID=2174844 RepID=UPI000D60F559|nr:peptidylprolyl isomerase [Maritimibacter sp. 55A14]PWE28787.1 peptidylprolyl isomerase [Maritimibacter sp. 55A14]
MANRIFAPLAALFLGLAPALAAEDENVLVIEVAGQSEGIVEIELLPQVAPGHVARIKELARAGAYDGVVFHRVIDGFMAQTGDVQYGRKDGGEPGMAGTGGSDLPDLEAEFSDLPFQKGVVGMARSQNPDSANSQFFIMFQRAPHLNGQYTVVGRVIAGQEVVDSIKRGSGQSGTVRDPDYMKDVRIKADG